MTSPHTLPERLLALRGSLKLDQEQMGKLLGVTREWVSRLETGKGTFSELVVLKIDQMERENSGHFAKVDESPADNIMPGRRGEPPSGARPPMRINPPHALPPDAPTRADIEKYLAAYLDLAAQIPGGIPNAYFEITEALPIEKLQKRLEKLSNPSP